MRNGRKFKCAAPESFGGGRLLLFLLVIGASGSSGPASIGSKYRSPALISDMGLLALSPIPCVLTFWKPEKYSPFAAFFTYLLLGLALVK
jgi:hypothetical protein